MLMIWPSLRSDGGVCQMVFVFAPFDECDRARRVGDPTVRIVGLSGAQKNGLRRVAGQRRLVTKRRVLSGSDCDAGFRLFLNSKCVASLPPLLP